MVTMAAPAHYWSMLIEPQQQAVRHEWSVLVTEIQRGAQGVQIDKLLASSAVALQEKWVDYPLEVLWYGLHKVDWTSEVYGKLTVSLMEAMGWVNLARELAQDYDRGLTLTKGRARTLWEERHQLNSARARVEATMIRVRLLGITSLGREDWDRGWRRLCAKMEAVLKHERDLVTRQAAHV
jgi:hypothetical protein